MTIMLTREEAQQVLDALEHEVRRSEAVPAKTLDAAAILFVKLLQPEVKPMAWLVTEDGKPVFLKGDKTPAAHVAKRKPNRKLIPLYAGIA